MSAPWDVWLGLTRHPLLLCLFLLGAVLLVSGLAILATERRRHSPSGSLLGRCRCHRQGCRRMREAGGAGALIAEGFRRGLDRHRQP